MNLQLQKLLEIPMKRRLSSFVGRGALDLNSEKTSLTEEIQIPSIGFVGTVRGKSMPVNFILNQESPEDLSEIDWALFHNGVAAGLKVKKEDFKSVD